jgi:DNA (cytosine-5)-methyltransferase 1
LSVYYNEINPFAAAWLRELMKAGQIPDGEVDTRSIADVQPDDLRGFHQCHFFAGIGGWAYALKLAGWPDDREVWTGSCPCQPFSSAGAQAGGDDPRDLWPAWFQLWRECRPSVVFGEQVEAAIGHGWLDRVCADVEPEGYAVGACSLPAASVGAFHIRQRLWFVADRLDDAGSARRGARPFSERSVATFAAGEAPERRGAGIEAGRGCAVDGLRSQGRELSAERAGECAARPTGLASFWSACDWLPCADGKARPVEPGTFPLAHGVSARVGRLRGYGNAIVPQVAQVFIEAYLEVTA